MIRTGQLRSYAAVGMPEDNVTLTGGVINLSTLIDFADLQSTDQLQVVSSDPDDALFVTIYGRLANGIISSETVAVTGQTPMPTIQPAWERLMKASKSTSSFGDIAVEQVTPVLTGTLAGGADDQIVLGSIGSSEDGAYIGLVFRATGGTGSGVIAKVLAYDGLTQTATLDKNVTVDGTTQFRLASGVVFFRNPHEILTVRRPFYGVTADVSNGADRVYYEKFFWRNDSVETLLQTVQVQEINNPTGLVQFALDPSNPSVSAVPNRLTPPDSSLMLVFGRTPQAVPFAQPNMASGQAVGVWLQFAVRAGQAPIRSSYQSGFSGQTV
jgi:hypothetical protein